MNAKRIGIILLGALALTVIILFIEVNFYDTDLTKDRINEILFWSFIKGLVISTAVHIGNSVRTQKNNNK